MFKSATVKLTITYSVILLVISLFFSVNLYHLSYRELERGLRRQAQDIQRSPRLRNLLPVEPANVGEQLTEGRRQIFMRLLYANVGIALLGGVGSYFLARLTLKPIEDAMQRQQRFSADASHELRTPLAAMQSETEVSLRDKNLTKSKARKQLESNLEEISKLNQIIDGLLDYAHNGGSNKKETIEIKALLESAKLGMLKEAKAKNCQIDVECEAIEIRANKDYMKQALSILIENAIKYSSENGHIKLTALRKRNYAQISIQDNGIGIDKSDLPYIFDRFYRAESSRSKHESRGYGLGLSIAKHIIEDAGGVINVNSKLNVGTTFTLKIPISN